MSNVAPTYRILLIGDYSNMHNQLARSLRALGHDVTLMSSGSGFQSTERDIDLSRRPGKLGGLRLAWRCRHTLHDRMSGYDIVALQNPHFLALKPRLLRYFFDRLRGENRSVFLTAAGTDAVYLAEALDPKSPLRYTEYRIGERPAPYALEDPASIRAWLDTKVRSFDEYVYRSVDGVVSGLYEYHVAAERFLGPDRVSYGGIPIDTAALEQYVIPDRPECVEFFLGRHLGRLAEKGTGILEDAARTVCRRHPGRCRLTIVENVPYGEYVGRMKGSHVVLDQIYSYSPATNAMLAMARGLVTVSGGEPEFYDFIGEKSNRPIVNAPLTLDATVETLSGLVEHPERLSGLGRDSRRFVTEHNDGAVVARRFLNAWTSRL